MRLQFDRRRGVVHVSQRKLQESRYVVTQSILTLIKNHLQQTNNLPNRLMITPQPTTNDVANEGACVPLADLPTTLGDVCTTNARESNCPDIACNATVRFCFG